MAMLNERHDECVATLDRERMAIEIIFRLKENGNTTSSGLDRSPALGLAAARSRPGSRPIMGIAPQGWSEVAPGAFCVSKFASQSSPTAAPEAVSM